MLDQILFCFPLCVCAAEGMTALFPFITRALTPCGKTSVPRPQNCTLNSGEEEKKKTVLE